ncbi:MAG: NAD(P)/FAD-dependent oxidoreductase [Methanophagales archaeon]|nr:NAD(P)/FAD-dependent oxidoreductase [Methanophagales archaeon]
MKDERYDVVVVGAGPAGSVTAKTAAEDGLEVLLIERNPEIGLPVKCGEGVSKEIERFVDIDSRWICTEPKGIITNGPDGTRVALSVEGSEVVGYVLERRLFDKFLAQQAAHAGAEVRVKTQAYDLLKEGGYAKGVYANAAGEAIRISADVVVGADGVESRVGRWAGIDTRLRLADVDICAQFLMSNLEVDKNFFEMFFGRDIAPKGYAWVFPKGDQCANVGLGIGGDVSGANHRALDYLRAFVNEKFPDGKILAAMYGAVPLSGPVYETVANGLVLVGDAARHVQPITGGGILQAMEGGAIAGEVIAKAVREKNVSKRRLMEYEKRWKHEFGKVLEVGLKAKNTVLSLSDEKLITFFRPLAGEIRLKECSERALLKEFIKRNPRILFSLLRVIF